MSDTPDIKEWVHITYARSLEQALRAADKRIQRLEDRCHALDHQISNLLEICRKHGVEVGSRDMIK